MPMRVSFTLDPETMDHIDKFAKEHGIERNRAILEFIENGYEKLTEGGTIKLNQQRAFEEYNTIRKDTPGDQAENERYSPKRRG